MVQQSERTGSMLRPGWFFSSVKPLVVIFALSPHQSVPIHPIDIKQLEMFGVIGYLPLLVMILSLGDDQSVSVNCSPQSLKYC
jgi:hypothetical protein